MLRGAYLVRNVKRVVVSSQTDVRLLFAVGTAVRMSNQRVSLHIGEDSPDEGVDLRSLDVVELLHRVLDLTLVRPDVSDEDEGVVLLDLLHGRLRVQWRDDRPELVHPGRMGDGLAGVLGVTGEAEGLGAVEGNSVASLALRSGVGARKSGLFGSLSLSIGFC